MRRKRRGITEPKLAVEITEAHFVVLPITHKVFVGFHIVSHLEDLNHVL